jgi:hypothetical protein
MTEGEMKGTRQRGQADDKSSFIALEEKLNLHVFGFIHRSYTKASYIINFYNLKD